VKKNDGGNIQKQNKKFARRCARRIPFVEPIGGDG
jgi:hypothetical protein